MSRDIETLAAENASLVTKLGHAQYAMDTVARFVRPRIPTDQNPEQATSFLAWIGMILRLEERAVKAEAKASTAMIQVEALTRALEPVIDSLNAAIFEYERLGILPGAVLIMQAQIEALRSLSKEGEPS